MNNKMLNRVRSIKGVFLLLCVWGVVAGCSEDSGQLGTENHKVVEVSCRLQVDPLKGEPGTRGERAAINGEWTENEEAAINNLTVIQFDGDGTDDEAQSVIVRTFNNPKLENLIIGLMQPPDNREQFLYFICNVGDVLSGFTGTLGELKVKQLTIDPAISASDGIVMTGTCRSTLVAGTPIKVHLMRRLVKIRFTYSSTGLPEGDSFEPVWLQLLSVPKAMELEPASETTNESVGFSDPDPVLDHIDQGYVWYIPENKRGEGSNTSGSVGDKDENHVPDVYCTYILLEGNYHQGSDNTDYKVYYRFYPGADNVNDFNLKGNHIYNVELNLTGIGSSDGRVSSTPMESLPGANCYMTAPRSTLTFNPYAAPGTDVSSIGWTYASRMGQKGDGKIDHVGLVWQTDPELIRNIYNLTSSGEIRLTTNQNSGNALVAAYDNNNRILWSWHIWVTDYSVAGIGDDITGTSAKVDHGYVYKYNNYIWMDRGPGALSNDRKNITNLGMSYQWGRKDPFVPANAFKNYVLTSMYDANGERVETNAKQFDQAYVTSVGDMFDNAMQNPLTFFTNGESGKAPSVSTSNECLWYGMSARTDLWTSTAKTFFDPCPAGWCVPPKSARPTANEVGYIYDTGTPGYGFYIKGLDGLFWPYTGYRNISTGTPSGVGGQGIYWTSDNGSNNGSNWANTYGASNDKWDQGSPFQQSRRHSDGMAARCVKIKP